MTLLTEKEAAEKWCPLSRAPGTMIDGDNGRHYVTQNRGHMMGQPIPGSMCIGSKCMAWRWNEPPGPRAPDDLREPDIRGYCGAFGKVEP